MVGTSDFITLLADSHMVTPELVDRLRERIAKHGGKVDPRSIAKWLVDKGHLSLWQAQQLLAGHNAFYLGRYRLIDRIGKGGMGVVFKAQHAVMDRTVALKVMSHRLLNNPRAVARFEREVKTLSALSHKNIIAAHDADRVGSTHFLVMEYVDGCDLNRWLRTLGPLPVSAAAEFIMQTAEGLRHATRRQLVHRDIKPVNLLLTWDQEEDRPIVKILDMGLARFISETQEDGGITRVGQLIGTPDYIAPEAAKNFTEADVRADIFSLGCAFFRLLTGRLPFSGNNAMEKLMARATEDAPDVTTLRPDVPAVLSAVVAKMLERDADDRYQSANDLIKAVKPFAASTLGDTATLELFRTPLPAPNEESDVDADADTSFEEFYRDFSVSPKSDAPSAPDEPPRPDKATGEGELSLALSEDDEDDALSLGAAIDDDHEPSADVDSPPSDDESSVDEELVVGAEMLSEVGAADTNRLSDYDSQMQTVQSLRSRRSGWDSPLMLVGGGMLMLLIALGGFLWWQLNRESGDEMLQQAEADYEASSYGQAIDKYDHYLERFPDHKDRSIAKVHRGLAQIRQAEQSSNWPRALEVTNGVLAAISSEAAFGEARNELAAVLPKISAGLAQQAREQPSEELIASAGGALALVDKYVIKSLRPTEQLEETTATLARAHRDLGRDNALAAAVASINESVADGDTNAAYAARRQLLRDYPDLQDNDALSKAVLAISASMKDAVVLSDEHRGAVVDQPAPPFAAKVILSSLDPESERTSVKSPIAALVRGSLFGLDGSTGGVIWHRFLGALSTNPPVTLTDTSAGDFLVVDTQHQQLVRLDGRTGEARWSQPLAVSENENTESTSAVYTSAEPIEAAPAVFGRRVVTGDSAGALSLYDLDTGELVRRALLPQSLRIAPAVSTDGNTIYAVAEHSNLFVLDARTGDCHEVYYLGHEPGTVRIPPIVVGRYVVVAENHRLDDSRLRILLASEDGTSVSEIQQVDIQGHVTTPPVISGGTMIVVTDLHAINAFEVQPLGNDDPFAKVLSRPPSSEQHMLRFAAIADGQLLVADERLTLYDVRAAGGRLPPKAVFFEGNRFLQPLRVEGDTVFLVHQPAGQPGAIATAVHGRDGESLWSAHIASPVAGKLLVDDAGKRLMAATTNASLFQVNVDDSSRSGVVSEPMAKSPDSVADRLSTTTDNVRVDPRRIVLGDSSSHQRLLLCDLAGAAARLRWLNLPAPLGGTPCVMSEGIVAPGEVGQVFWLDADSGSQLASPFQTTLATDLKHHWHMAPLPKEDALIVADDATPILYRLGVEPGNQPALAAGAERELTAPIARGFAVSGEAAFAVDRDDRLLVINSTSLDELASHKLDAPAVWGPTVVGELVLIGTDSGAVQAFTVEGNPAWTHAASGERLVGATLRDNSNIVLGFDNGQVREVNTEAGETVGEVNLDRPLLRGPVMWQGRAVFAAPDGTIYAIDLP